MHPGCASCVPAKNRCLIGRPLRLAPWTATGPSSLDWPDCVSSRPGSAFRSSATPHCRVPRKLSTVCPAQGSNSRPSAPAPAVLALAVPVGCAVVDGEQRAAGQLEGIVFFVC